MGMRDNMEAPPEIGDTGNRLADECIGNAWAETEGPEGDGNDRDCT